MSGTTTSLSFSVIFVDTPRSINMLSHSVTPIAYKSLSTLEHAIFPAIFFQISTTEHEISNNLQMVVHQATDYINSIKAFCETQNFLHQHCCQTVFIPMQLCTKLYLTLSTKSTFQSYSFQSNSNKICFLVTCSEATSCYFILCSHSPFFCR